MLAFLDPEPRAPPDHPNRTDRRLADAAPADPGTPRVEVRGEKGSNATHARTTDPPSRLARKGEGKEATLSFACV